MEPSAVAARGDTESPPDGPRRVGVAAIPSDAAARVAEAAAALAFSRFGGPGDSVDGSAPSGDGVLVGEDGDLRRRLSEMLSQRESLEAIKGSRDSLVGASSAASVEDGARAAFRRDSAVSVVDDDDDMSLGSADLGASDRHGGAKAGGAGGQSQRSLSVSLLEEKDFGVLSPGNDAMDAVDAGNGTHSDSARALEQDGRSGQGMNPTSGGWGYNSSIGSVTSLFRGSIVRVLGRKRSDSTSSAAAAAPSHQTQLPYRPRRRGATVRRRRDSSPEDGDMASSLLMVRFFYPSTRRTGEPVNLTHLSTVYLHTVFCSPLLDEVLG